MTIRTTSVLSGLHRRASSRAASAAARRSRRALRKLGAAAARSLRGSDSSSRCCADAADKRVLARRTGSSSSSTTATGCSPSKRRRPGVLLYSRAGNDSPRRLPEIASAIARAAVRALRARRRDRRARRATACPTSRCSKSAGALRAARTPSARRSSCRRRSSCSICSPSPVSTCARCRSLERKALLSTLLPTLGPLRYARAHRRARRGAARAGRRARARGRRRARRRTRRTASKRSHDWLKIKPRTPERLRGRAATRRRRAARTVLGALQLAAVRRTASSSTPAASALASTTARSQGDRAELERRRRAEPPARAARPRSAATRLDRAGSRVQVQFTRVDAGRLAAPAGVRAAARRQVSGECDAGADAAESSAAETETRWQTRRPSGQRLDRPAGPHSRPQLDLTNLDKLVLARRQLHEGRPDRVLPRDRPWLLPYLANRPVVLTRFPDGIDGKSFYPEGRAGVRAEWLRARDDVERARQREIHYFVLDDVDVARSTSRTSARSRCTSGRAASRALEQPDWCVVDLDPKEAPLTRRRAARARVHELCETIGLPNYVKTTG